MQSITLSSFRTLLTGSCFHCDSPGNSRRIIPSRRPNPAPGAIAMTSSTETTVSGPPGEPDEITTAEPEVAAELVGRSPGQLMWLRFKRDRAGVISAYVVGFFFVVAIFAPVIAKLYGKNPYTLYGQYEPGLLDDFGYPVAPNGGVSGRFWFGIEPKLGRDVFTQLIYG